MILIIVSSVSEYFIVFLGSNIPATVPEARGFKLQIQMEQDSNSVRAATTPIRYVAFHR